MSPAEAYRAAYQAAHPERHAPGDCPCREGHSTNRADPFDDSKRCDKCGHHLCAIARCDFKVQTCPGCDPRLDPAALLPPEVQAAVAGMARACVDAARTCAAGAGNPAWWATDDGACADACKAGADAVATTVKQAARECGVEVP